MQHLGGRSFFLVCAFAIAGAASLALMYGGGGALWGNLAFTFGLPWSLLFTQLGLVSLKSVAQNGWLLVLAVGVNTGFLWAWLAAAQRARA